MGAVGGAIAAPGAAKGEKRVVWRMNVAEHLTGHSHLDGGDIRSKTTSATLCTEPVEQSWQKFGEYCRFCHWWIERCTSKI